MSLKLTTVRQRMAVYQAALKLYEKGKNTYFCLCFTIEQVAGVKVCNDLEMYCPELWKQKPKKADYLWWPAKRENIPLRISALTAAIKECRKKLKSKK